jgi:hypothetical protein
MVALSHASAPPPDAAERYPGVRWIERPGASVFELRAAALECCGADVVAITEDHARVAPDWCERILAAHEEHPEAAAIGGVVENGATDTLCDRAGFFVANGPFLSPIRNGPAREISQQANVSYKRHRLPAPVGPGLMVLTLHAELRRLGATLLADERLVVHHVQHLTLRGHSVGHFHNGRSIAAFRVAGMRGWMRPVRALGCFLLPPVMLWRTFASLLPKRRYGLDLLVAVPMMVWFLCCHAAGEFLGYVAGPGRGPHGVN